MLCTVCLALTNGDWTTAPPPGECRVFKHQPSWTHLAESAAAGCQLCLFFEANLLYRPWPFDRGTDEAKSTWNIEHAQNESERRVKPQHCIELKSHKPLAQGFQVTCGARGSFIDVFLQQGRFSQNL
jgi:hypothetical protein